ncbi:MAG: EamA family transporter [Lachnospiraceae bacterium]|nr:EamA family transporter [Lachnospiraceae bacterium]
MWILFVLIYGVLKGVRDVSKKLAVSKSGVTEVLFVYTLIAFLFTTPEIPNAGGVPTKEMLLIAFKSFIIFVAFLCSFHAIKKMPVSLYGVLDLSRMLFAFFIGIFWLKETPGILQIVGMLLVSAGLLLLRFKPGFLKTSEEAPHEASKEPSAAENSTGKGILIGGERVAGIVLIMAFVSTFLNAVSGNLDKYLMSTGNVTSGQLQFWYMLFMLIYYGIYVLVTKTKITKSVWKNGYVWLISILFFVADRCLFIANGYPESKVTVMTLLKQICVVVTILGGRLIFKEKNIGYKLFCAGVVVAGIVIAAI